MREEFVIGISDVHEVAERVLAQFQSGQARVLALYGDIGTGKTTFMQALLAAAGVSGPMQSPTFSYVHRYELKQGIDKPLYHFDLYRLSGKSDFFTAGFDEYLYDEHALVCIEWPEILEEALPPATLRIRFAYGASH